MQRSGIFGKLFSKKERAELPPRVAASVEFDEAHASAAQLRHRDICRLIQTITTDQLRAFDPHVKNEIQRIYQLKDTELLSRMTSLLYAVIAQDVVEYAADLLTMMQLIEDDELVKTYFDEFEICLQKHAVEIGCVDQLEQRPDGKVKLKDGDANKHKILSSFMYQWAINNGFQHIAKTARNLDANDFLKLLSSQTFFKEIGTGFAKEHGSWSHALQWFVIISHQQKTHCFSHPPLDIYRKLSQPDNAKIPVPLWGKILDIYQGYSFGSPEYMNTFFLHYKHIKENENRWPLLIGTMQRIQRKEDKTEKQIKKKYGKNYKAGVVKIDKTRVSVRG